MIVSSAVNCSANQDIVVMHSSNFCLTNQFFQSDRTPG